MKKSLNYKAFYKKKNREEFLKQKKILDKLNFIESKDNDFDFVLIIGGDGTFLYTINYLLENNMNNVKILAFNCGNLGFLIPFDISEIENVLKKFNLLKIYKMTVNNVLIDDKIYYFVNDIVISNNSKVIDTKILHKNQIITTQKTSGYVLSSRLGSFGFNKSFNGPLLIYENDNYVITPIAAIHNNMYNGFSNALILNDFTIMIDGECRVTIDGHKNIINCKKIEKVLKYNHINILTINTKYIINNINRKILN